MGPEASPRQPSLRGRGPARGPAPTRPAKVPARHGSHATRRLQQSLNAAVSQCWKCAGRPMGDGSLEASPKGLQETAFALPPAACTYGCCRWQQCTCKPLPDSLRQ